MSDSLVRFRQTSRIGRRSLAAATLALITVGALTACGSDASTGGAASAAPSVAPTSSAASSPADLPGMPHHPGPAGPLVGEQFGPLTVTTPGPAR